jgi:hypothetical protein
VTIPLISKESPISKAQEAISRFDGHGKLIRWQIFIFYLTQGHEFPFRSVIVSLQIEGRKNRTAQKF